MKINTAKFEISNTDYTKCPAGNKPEYAFIGRSNVGKSSLINMLTNHKGPRAECSQSCERSRASRPSIKSLPLVGS